MKVFLTVVSAALLIGSTAVANNHEYKPAKGVTIGGGSAAGPKGIHPECAAKTNRTDMKDCIKEKAREAGKAKTLKGKKQ